MLEYEKKIMLTGDEYISLVMLLCKYAPVIFQTNYYFDTDDLSMNKKGVTCRIRAKDGIFKTTVKSHFTDNTDCSLEEELAVKKAFEPDLFNTFGLRHQGELVTGRIIIYKDSACKAVVDQNTYLGFTDYELEVEYFDGYEKKAMDLLQNIAERLVAAGTISDAGAFLKRVGKSKSKSERFFERKLKTQKEGGRVNDFGFK